MHNIFFSLISFVAFIGLGFWQSVTPIGDLTAYKDIGMGTAFIATCIWMFRYFTQQIEKQRTDHKQEREAKDAHIKTLTAEFIEMSKKYTESNIKTESVLASTEETLRDLINRVDRIS